MPTYHYSYWILVYSEIMHPLCNYQKTRVDANLPFKKWFGSSYNGGSYKFVKGNELEGLLNSLK